MNLTEYLATPDDWPDLPFEPQPVGEAVRSCNRLLRCAINRYYQDALSGVRLKSPDAPHKEALADLQGDCLMLQHLCTMADLDFRWVKAGMLRLISCELEQVRAA